MKNQKDARKAFLEQGKMKREADRKATTDAQAAKKREEIEARAAAKPTTINDPSARVSCR